jgi:hypothetical protein
VGQGTALFNIYDRRLSAAAFPAGRSCALSLCLILTQGARCGARRCLGCLLLLCLGLALGAALWPATGSSSGWAQQARCTGA